MIGRPGLPRSLGTKLFAAQVLVILAGSATLLLVALTIGPGIFRHHIRDALGIVPLDVGRHLDHAFGQAMLVALGVAVAAALVTALAVSWLVAVRVVRPIRGLAGAATRIAAGAYGARVPAGGGDEIATLAAAFNELAASLEAAETRRRELLADVAHELRTPLATVEGYVEGLADRVLEPDDETWSALRTETRRLARLVDDLRKVSLAEERQLDLRIVRLSLADLVEAALHSARPAFVAKGVRLEQRLGSRLPRIDADPDRLGEVLGNLLENALRHTPAGGGVEISARRDRHLVELAVADTGEGLAPEHLDRVFERFYRADVARARLSGGSGIGLTIVRAIVEAHRGVIRAESDGPGCGSRFVITLPVASAAAGDDG